MEQGWLIDLGRADREGLAAGGDDMRVIFPWKRFWIPREATPQPDGYGFFADPENWYGKIANPQARTLDDLEETPCLVLLGEPGIGKSKTVEAYGDNIAKNQGPSTIAIDLRVHRDLERAIFSTDKFRQWHGGQQRLHLIVDSLDEHRDGALEVVHRLLIELEGGPVEALRLRIACRTVQWPASVDEHLHRLWKGAKGQAVAFRTLAPLRRTDVAALFQAETGGDPEPFLAEIERVKAAALAIKPITLQFLLTEYREGSKLPDARRDLYERGCKKLCETSISRHDSGDRGLLSVEHRLAVASRLAALTVLTGRGHVLHGPDRGSTPSDVLRLAEVTTGTESSPLGDVEVTAGAVMEVLEVTGLFRSAEPGCAQWTHQTYAEFLAARFLHRRGLTAEQIVRDILCPSGRPIPSLSETAAWLANLDKDVFRALLRMHPELLLGSDFAMLEDNDRAALVAALLEKIDRRELLGSSLIYRRHVTRQLQHPGLAAQLRRYIGDRTRYKMVRRVAIDMVEACEVADLYEMLAATARDPAEDIEIRSAAAEAVASVGSPEAKRRLLPLVSSENDELKGYALQALWPSELTPEDLFKNLTSPRGKYYGGSYAAFLLRLEGELTPSVLPAALAWAAGLPAQHQADFYFGFRSLLDRIIAAGWEHIDNPSVCAAFAVAARARLLLYENILDPMRTNDGSPTVPKSDRQRRLLVDSLVRLEPIGRSGESLYVYYGLVQAQDIEWAVDRAKRRAETPERTQRFAILGEMALRYQKLFEVMDGVIGALEDLPELRKAMPWFSFCVELSSQEAEAAREEFCTSQKRKNEYERIKDEHKRQIPQTTKLIRECLAVFGDDNLDAGWELYRWMWIDEVDGSDVGQSERDILDAPGWLRADEEMRASILSVGRDLLLRCDDDAVAWLGKNVFSSQVLAGYGYITLLSELDPAWMQSHSVAVYTRWAATVVAFQWDKNAKRNRKLLRDAYNAVPDRLLSLVSMLLEKDNEVHDYPLTLTRMQECWDDRLGRSLLDFARRPSLKPNFLRELLGQVIAHKVAGAVPYARSLLAPIGRPGTPDRLRSQAAAQALLLKDLGAGWSAVWGALRDDTAFGCAVFILVARSHETQHSGAWGESIPADEAGELYLWLESQFPRQSVPREAHEVTSQEMLDNLKNLLLNGLVNRGTPAAVHAVERIGQALPGRDFTWEIQHANDIAAEKSWVPLTPRAIVGLRKGRSEAKSPKGSPLWLYISCDVGDNSHRECLEKHLSSVCREGLVEIWPTRGNNEGEGERLAVSNGLNQSDIIVLLVSANYIHSDYCMDVEVSLAKDRHQRGYARTFVVAVSPADRGTLFEEFEVLPRGDEPVTSWVSENDAWMDVVSRIRDFASGKG